MASSRRGCDGLRRAFEIIRDHSSKLFGVQHTLDTELAEVVTKGQPVCLRRAEDGELRLAGIGASIGDCLTAVGIDGHHPVLVLVGGAGFMDREVDENAEKLARRLRRVMDLAVVRSVEQSRAVVLTGGTAHGLMRLAGECFRDRGAVALIGVAPRKKVTVEPDPREVGDARTSLDVNHDGFVLTAGEEWGAETEALFGLAQHLAGSGRAGLVVLANGGDVARQEASRFLEAGWPVMTLLGTERAADDLAHAWTVPGRTHPVRRRRSKKLRTLWGELERAQVEVYEMDSDQEEGLARRLSWHLSTHRLLKNGFSSWAAYDAAATAGRRLTRRVQRLSVGLAGVLTVGSLVDGSYTHPDALEWALVTLPVLLALNGSVLDFMLPRRNWMAMRGAAQAAERAVYRYRAHSSSPASAGAAPDDALVRDLAVVRERLTRAGVRSVVAPPIGRPSELPDAYDELGDLTVREYTANRLDGQLTYYRNAARRLEQRQLASLAASAVLAAVATWAASEVFAARWVPVLVLTGAVLVILQQRAKWQDRVALYNAAIADLQGVRDRHSRADDTGLEDLVAEVEDALERESVGWLQNMSQSASPLPPSFA